jgi:hypothetical protein
MQSVFQRNATHLLLAFGVSMACAQGLAQASPAPVVSALNPGVCQNVADGDIVTLDWNPAFDDMSSVTGLQEMSLRFVKMGDEAVARRTRAGLILTAGRQRPAPVDEPIVAEPNGYFRIRFQVNLRQSEPGEYRLAEATAEAALPNNFPGRHPRMTNDPVRSAFCFNVVASAPVRRR